MSVNKKTHAETIADIVAEKRRLAAEMEKALGDQHSSVELLKDDADRIEAAHKRERGDAAKLREAVCEILSYIESFHKYITPGKGKKLTALFAVADTIRNNARAALAAPPRNCDVGIPEEQDERFHRFCVMQRTGSCAGCPDPVGGRTVANGIRECALVWAQMPYEEGGAK